MLKKLRRKFVAIAMISISIVLIAIVGTINIANYISTNNSLDARLELIAGNGGTFPDLSAREPDMSDDTQESQVSGTKESTENTEKTALQEPPSGTGDVKPPEGMRQEDLNRHGISPESQFDTRYFTVTLSSAGDVEKIDTGKIATISSKTAAEYASELWDDGTYGGGKSGFTDNFKYMTVDKDGSTMYIFLNCQRELSTIKAYIWASIGISTLGLIVVFLMIYFFSGKILKPVSESYEKQKRFITDASHEIKTPLTIIDANTEVIEMMEGENEWTKSTRKQVARLTSLTEKLVFLSRMDEESTKLTMCEFSLSDAVLDTAEPFKAVAQTKDKKLEINVDEGISYVGDEKTIRQLISILLDNAMKYSESSISITLKTSGRNRMITVWNTVDESANIKKGRQDILFERFYRADSSHNSKTGGFGIGLSAAYAIVRAHKGRISARSEDGRSIEFMIVL